MDFSKLVPIEWSNRRVLTTAQLAQFYGCDARHIKQNFNNNRDRFIEGKHYFKLEGAALAAFKTSLVDGIDQAHNYFDQALKFAPVLYLWTERGAARHAKMLSTDKAWEVFEDLEDNYFNPKPSILSAPAPVAKPEPVVTFPEAIYRVYAILFKGGIVKTGCTKRLCTRMSEVKREFKREIERATKYDIVDIYFSPLMYCEDARLVERCCKEIFSSQLVKGEFFSVKFDNACKAVNTFVSAVNILSSAPKHYIATGKLLADKNSN